eukprot:CAMPEP_0172471836 /NCGR_PEP_ID=MMETSP1065-20121228/68020_1 /TAXON_ID=265537 /ORGANISM="Amphiprora paludosa, Strain CCMP125" /LENGTH=954 /DNA_ID=CAMNT_0013229951 /DNA_START=9 /DNA_END=2873 /DNA_ORIENTATION=-
MAARPGKFRPIPGCNFSPEERQWLESLWRTYHRDLIEVRPTLEPKLIIPDSAVQAVDRVHKFIVAVLHAAIHHAYARDQDGDIDDGYKERGVKAPDNNSLREFLFHAVTGLLVSNPTCHEEEKEETTHASINLGSCGRKIFSVSHEEFTREMDEFERRGEASTETNQRKTFGAFLHHHPERSFACIGCALALASVTVALTQSPQTQNDQYVEHAQMPLRDQIHKFVDSTQYVVRFLHVGPTVNMMNVKTSFVGKLISIKGHIVKARAKRLRLATAEFNCHKCGASITHAFEDGRYSMPTACQMENCSSRTFSFNRSSARYINMQELRLQESQEESTSQAGRAPRQLVVEVGADLVETCRPGDMVKVAGIISAVNTALAAGKRGKKASETSTYELYLIGHSISTLSESNSQKKGGSRQTMYTNEQLQNITQLCHADHQYFGFAERRAFPFDLLVRSLCPSIIGHDCVKAGLLLCLLGGSPHEDNGTSTIRSNSHMLVVGDPGMGKSQMLLAASQLSARSVYVGGNTSTTTGLTVTLGKEEKSGESSIEAGALVLADQGVCCIDEFDKMAKNHQDGLLEAMEQQQGIRTESFQCYQIGPSLRLPCFLFLDFQFPLRKLGLLHHYPADQGVCCIDEFDKMAKNHQDGLLEAMEQQQVSIAKAGVVASLPARCSLIAAANPRGGSYNMDRTVSENLNMAKPILSRFDLVFILRDRADSSIDRMVSSNIMNLYRKTPLGEKRPNTNQPSDSTGAASQSESEKRLPLADRLAWVTDMQKQPLPAELVRDYIAYAREYCKPKLTPEAASVLKEYFMELRYPSEGPRKGDTVPITTRQLEALIRLCQARAKACLRDFCLKEDAMDVVELMSLSVSQVHSNESGNLDPIRGGAGGASKRKVKKAFVQQVQRLVGVGNDVSESDLRQIAMNVNCGLSEFNDLVEDLRGNGVLIKKQSGCFRVLS